METWSVLRWVAQGRSKSIWKGTQRNGCEWPVTRIHVLAERTSSFRQISCQNCRYFHVRVSSSALFFKLPTWLPTFDLLRLLFPFLVLWLVLFPFLLSRWPASILLYHSRRLLILRDPRPSALISTRSLPAS